MLIAGKAFVAMLGAVETILCDGSHGAGRWFEMTYLKKRRMNNNDKVKESPLSAAVAMRDVDILTVVKDAINHRDVVMAYQPVMQARKPHGAAFYEGLIRVLDDTGRIIPAREFMGRVADTELGRELDCISLDLGLQTLSQNPNIRLSINMSARSIGYDKWHRTLERHLKRDKALGDRLIVEIIEKTTMAVPELVTDYMDRLQPRGIAFALDEFGADLTYIRHLRDFFFDAVKIHGAYVRGISQSPDNQAAVRALSAIAREFDMFVVATSVEKIEDAEFMTLQGVDCLQGYLFGAPSVRPPWKEKDRQKSA